MLANAFQAARTTSIPCVMNGMDVGLRLESCSWKFPGRRLILIWLTLQVFNSSLAVQRADGAGALEAAVAGGVVDAGRAAALHDSVLNRIMYKQNHVAGRVNHTQLAHCPSKMGAPSQGCESAPFRVQINCPRYQDAVGLPFKGESHGGQWDSSFREKGDSSCG